MRLNTILLDHGSGGSLSHDLTKKIFLPVFSNTTLNHLDDGAMLTFGNCRIAFSTDTYVVDPIFFPGGSIGDLAINGTVNDISMCGANPQFLSVGFVLEEGFPINDLKKIVFDMGEAAQIAGVKIVTGDTKVVPKGAIDKIFINTSGVGTVIDNVNVSSRYAQVGDKIILSGCIAEHGITIMTQRQGFNFESKIQSDTCSLNFVVQKILKKYFNIHVLRDPTRGGIGTSLNEIAIKSQIGIKIFEDKIPLKPEVSKVCDLLGFDPLYIANEGRFMAFVSDIEAEQVLKSIRNDQNCKEACIIGEVIEENKGQVLMETSIGGKRIVGMLVGEQLPRIC